MARTIVGVLRGGASSEYDLSLKTGSAMMRALPEERYDVRDIFIDKSGVWHLRGMPMQPMRALSQIDVVLNALHGGAGEDGTVQRILERSSVPYAGSRALGSSRSLNKGRAREILLQAGVRMPRGVHFSLEGSDMTTADMARAVFSRFGPPYVLKAGSEGSSHGIRFASTVLELPDIIGDILDAHGTIVVEEFLAGDESHTGLVEGFRGEDFYVLPPTHVMKPASARFYDPYAHESGAMRHLVPSNFSHADKQAIAEAMRAAHRALGLGHYSSANFIVTSHGPYLLELDTTPHLYPGAAFPPMLESVGSSVGEFLEHAINLARSA